MVHVCTSPHKFSMCVMWFSYSYFKFCAGCIPDKNIKSVILVISFLIVSYFPPISILADEEDSSGKSLTDSEIFRLIMLDSILLDVGCASIWLSSSSTTLIWFKLLKLKLCR